jgi:hypothetical protein
MTQGAPLVRLPGGRSPRPLSTVEPADCSTHQFRYSTSRTTSIAAQPIMIQSAKLISNTTPIAHLPVLVFDDQNFVDAFFGEDLGRLKVVRCTQSLRPTPATPAGCFTGKGVQRTNEGKPAKWRLAAT